MASFTPQTALTRHTAQCPSCLEQAAQEHIVYCPPPVCVSFHQVCRSQVNCIQKSILSREQLHNLSETGPLY